VSDLHNLSKPKVPDTPEGMLALLGNLSDDELHELFEAQRELEQRLHDQGPQDDDELHDWLIAELGIDIPRVAVCEDHQAPFDFLADLFFERTEAALGVANRGGAKTFLVAVLHWLNSRFKPGCESCTFGAIEAQSFRAYAHLKQWVYDQDGNRIPEVVSSLMKETIFTNGSKIEVLGTTAEAVNGPHPQKSHADEIELMRDDTWKESRNMTVSGKTRDGRQIIPQDIATSTRKGPSGRVQALINEIDKAISEGYTPPRKLYMWCIKETAAQVKNCQVARPDLPDALKCPCHKHRRGEWDDGSPRLLRDVCAGDFHRSRGWQPYQDTVKQFKENDRETFEVQQLCSKPELKFHYVPQWKDEKHCIRGFVPDPENGPIFQAVDWGGTNPHAVNWYQYLTVEIDVDEWMQLDPAKRSRKRLFEGTLVCFDEIYVAEIGNDKLAELVKRKEAEYRAIWPHWRPYERYADPQGKAARMDWKAKGLLTVWHTTREFDEHIKIVKDVFDDDLMYVDGEKCPMFVKEIKAWRRDERAADPTKQLDEFNHCMSNFRYALANIKKVKRRAIGTTLPQARTIQRTSVSVRQDNAPMPPIGFKGRKDEFDEWRKSLGEPVTRVRT